MNKNTLLVIGGVVIVTLVLLGKSFLSNDSTANKDVANQVNVAGNLDQQATTH